MSAKKGYLKLVSTSFLIYPLSFLNQLLLSYHFGASAQIDSYWIALTGINFLTLFTGPVKDALVPHYFTKRSKNPDQATGYLSARFNLILMVSLFSFTLCLSFSDQIAALLVDEAQKDLVAPVSRLLLYLSPAILLIPITQALEGILLGFKRYFIQMVGRLLGTLGSIAVLLLLVDQLGIFALVAGNLGAMSLFLLWQAKESRAQGMEYRPLTKPGADWPFIKLVLSLLAIFVFAQVYAVFENRVFTSFGTGLVSSYKYGMSLTQIPQNILVVALTAVLWPKIIEHKNAEELPQVFTLTMFTSKQLTMALVFISLLAWVFAEPVIRLTYQRGAFTEEDVQTTVLCFKALTLSIVPFGLINIFHRVLSSLMLSRALFWAGLAHALAGSACLFLGQLWGRFDLAAVHLLAASSLNLLVCLVCIYKATGTPFTQAHLREFLRWALRLSLVALAFLLVFPLEPLPSVSKLSMFVSLSWQSLAGGLLLCGLSLLVGLVRWKEVTSLLPGSKSV